MIKKIISTSFAPNFQRDDVSLAMKLLLGGNLNNSHGDLRTHVSQLFNSASEHERVTVTLFSSARAGLMYSLKAIGIENDDEVLLQAFTCVAVCDAIIWAGAKPVFVDIDPETLNMDPADLDRKISPKTKAIIFQHTFGNDVSLKNVVEIARKKNIPVIEDRAHVFDEKPILGDCAVFSFGRDKAISSVFGGVVVCRNAQWNVALQGYENDLTKAPFWFAAQQLLYLPLYAISLALYPFGIGRATLFIAAKLGILSKAVYPQETKGGKPHFLHFSFHPKLTALALHQLKKLQKINDHRKNLTSLYAKNLRHVAPQKNSSDAALLRFPLRVTDKSHFLAKAKNEGLHLGNWYRGAIDPPHASKTVFRYAPCPHAEDAANHIVNLPTHINTSTQDAIHVIKFVQMYFSANPQ